MATLEEQQQRVERAQDALVEDVRQLERARRQMSSKVVLVAGGAALVGVLLVRSALRRRRRAYRVAQPTPSVLRDTFRVIALEIVRQIARNVGPRLLRGSLSTPRLAGASTNAATSRPVSVSSLSREAEPE